MLYAYRETLMARFRRCRGTGSLHALLAEADQMLIRRCEAEPARDRFWDHLDRDLDLLEKEGRFMLDREAGIKVLTIVSAARARIGRYRQILKKRLTREPVPRTVLREE
jgi:hypothetical protein